MFTKRTPPAQIWAFTVLNTIISSLYLMAADTIKDRPLSVRKDLHANHIGHNIGKGLG